MSGVGGAAIESRRGFTKKTFLGLLAPFLAVFGIVCNLYPVGCVEDACLPHLRQNLSAATLDV
jgi:hypothetical protein